MFFSFSLSIHVSTAGELGNAVQDAFVIAVEQQARERLQRLSALKRITPVDMSQLSIKVSANRTSSTKRGGGCGGRAKMRINDSIL